MTDGGDGPTHRVSARVIEEGYIQLHESMRTYRQARDRGNAVAGLASDTDPVLVLQDSVQTFFELVRPYLKDEPRLAEYWRGALAQYPDETFHSATEALEYYVEHSVGVWQTQQHTGAIPTARLQKNGSGNTAEALADGGATGLQQWHDALTLPPTVRLLHVEPAFDDEDFDGWYYREGRFAVLGLREVDRWQVRRTTERVNGEGFMGGNTATDETVEGEPAAKVETAARMLVEVADELGAIVSYEPSGERVFGTPVPE